MSEWSHKGQDIIQAVSKAPHAIKRSAAYTLLGQGAMPRHIRRKLKMSHRQLKKVIRQQKREANA